MSYQPVIYKEQGGAKLVVASGGTIEIESGGALESAARLQTSIGVGTAGTNCTAVEYGDGFNHTTIITLASVAATIGDNAALAGGAVIYTFPAGAYTINGATMSVGITLTTGTPTTDDPELGLGSLVGSGVNATLGAVDAAAEDISAGPIASVNLVGTAALLTSAPALSFEAADSHVCNINYADTWADVDDTAATLSGTVVLNWTLLPLS